MAIIFTFSCLRKIKRKNISKEEVIETIKNPDSKIKVIKKVDNEVLVVIYRREENKIVVITTFKSSKIQKYLK